MNVFLDRSVIEARVATLVGMPRLRARKRGFFAMPISAGECCELDSSFGPGIALAVSQATLAAPLLTASTKVRLFCNETLCCILSAEKPNARLSLDVKVSSTFVCRGPKGSCVHIGGYTYQISRPADEDATTLAVDDGESDHGLSNERYEKLQRDRKRRLEELQREAAADAACPSDAAPPRNRRLTFNPTVVVAEYIPKRSGIFPERAELSLDAMVAIREQIKARERERQAAESMGGEDDGEALQHILAQLLSCSLAKLRVICKANGVDRQGDKSAMIERLVDYYQVAMREERGEADS